MPIVTGEQVEKYGAILRQYGLPFHDFQWTETKTPPALRTESTAGWVTVRRVSTASARTYSAGIDLDWLSSFLRDLESGVFGPIPGRRPG